MATEKVHKREGSRQLKAAQSPTMEVEGGTLAPPAFSLAASPAQRKQSNDSMEESEQEKDSTEAGGRILSTAGGATPPPFTPSGPETPGITQRKSTPENFRPDFAKHSESLQQNNGGLPAQLKSGMESISGVDLSDVNVHYNSAKPAQLQAHAYAQGSDIHLGAGQEQHLPHEAWHVVQQKQGRVQPTTQLKGNVEVNDDPGLENEADVMGAKAMAKGVQLKAKEPASPSGNAKLSMVQRKASGPVQRVVQFESYFIGSAASIHIHVCGTQTHLKLTGHGRRTGILPNRQNNGYRHQDCKDALEELKTIKDAHGESTPYKDVEAWLKEQIELSSNDNDNDNANDNDNPNGNDNANDEVVDETLDYSFDNSKFENKPKKGAKGNNDDDDNESSKAVPEKKLTKQEQNAADKKKKEADRKANALIKGKPKKDDSSPDKSKGKNKK